jgi:hypothetical protein
MADNGIEIGHYLQNPTDCRLLDLDTGIQVHRLQINPVSCTNKTLVADTMTTLLSAHQIIPNSYHLPPYDHTC